MALQSAVWRASCILKHINKYAEKHGEIALSLAGEWLFQDDKGITDAIDLVADLQFIENVSPNVTDYGVGAGSLQPVVISTTQVA